MQTARQPEPAKLARIALMTLNFQSMLRLNATSTGTLEVFDVAKMYADVYGVHNIEMQHSHILSTEESYLRDLRASYAKEKSQITNINLEFGAMTISAADPALRIQAIDLTRRWIDHAVLLGSPRVMINQGQLSHDNKEWSVDALKKMEAYGKSKGVRVGVETRGNGGAPGGGRGAAAGPGTPGTPGAGRGGIQAVPIPSFSVIPAWVLLSEVIRDGGAWANVDMGNVGAQDEGELFVALRTLIPLTTGNTHTRVSQYWDLARVVRFMNGPLGYTGLFSIETNNADAVRNVYNIMLDAL